MTEFVALGESKLARKSDCIKALVVEFISTFLFVFISVSTVVATEKQGLGVFEGLFVVAIVQAFFVSAIVSAAHVSGGHLNPAVTLGLLVGGHITAVRSALYWVVQLVASSLACLLVQFLTGAPKVPLHSLQSGVSEVQGVVWEIVLTFSLLFTVYGAILDPKKGPVDGLGYTLTGLLVGASTLAGGSYTGASMNPARSFGPALVNWDWTNHWVYWAGPLIGAALAGLIYQNFFMPKAHSPFTPTDSDEEANFW